MSFKRVSSLSRVFQRHFKGVSRVVQDYVGVWVWICCPNMNNKSLSVVSGVVGVGGVDHPAALSPLYCW